MLPSKYVWFLKSPWKESFFMRVIIRTVNLPAELLPDTGMNDFWTEIRDFVQGKYVGEVKWNVCLTLILELWGADFSAENASKIHVLIYPHNFYIIKWASCPALA